MTRFSTGCCRSKWVRRVFALAAVLAAVGPLPWAFAQGNNVPRPGEPTSKPEERQAGDNEAPPPWHYDELEVKEELKDNHKDIKRILGEGDFQADEQATFDAYYKDYYLARWTLEKNLANLAWCQGRSVPHGGGSAARSEQHANYRFDLRSQFRSTSGAVYSHLNELVLDFMTRLVDGNYHPAVRVNAMLAIGELTEEPKPPTSPPPLPAALTVLIARVKNGALPDCVRVAAMTGILRHVEAGTADDEVRKIFLGVPAGELRLKNERIQDWFLGQALTGLGLLGSVGDNHATFQVIVKTLDDAKHTLCTRSIAAEALAELDYRDVSGINVADAAATLARFAIAACDEETNPDVKRPTGEVERGRLRQRLETVLRALNGSSGNHKGIRSLAKEDAKEDEGLVDRLMAFHKLLHQASDDLDDPAKTMEARSTVETLRSALDSWLKGKAEAAEPAP